MNYNEEIKVIRDLLNNKAGDEAKAKLLAVLEASQFKTVEDDEKTYYSFNNYVEVVMHHQLNRPRKKNVWPDINFAEVYFYLGRLATDNKEYDQAITYYKKGLERNPVDVWCYFYLASVYAIKGEPHKYRATVEKTHRYIYRKTELSRFYCELGYYYMRCKQYNLANALYSQGLKYKETNMAQEQLKKIAELDNREYKITTDEEIKELFYDYNIPLGFSRDTLFVLEKEHDYLTEHAQGSKEMGEVAKALYEMTGNIRYLPDIPEVRAQMDEQMKQAQSKTEKKEEPKENSGMEVECPVCQKTFKFNRTVPETEKAFYCDCPHCGTEIKRANPNYKGW